MTLEETVDARVFSVEAITTYHVLAHSAAEANARVADLAQRTPLEFDGGHLPWIKWIAATPQASAAGAADVTEFYQPDSRELGAEYQMQHAETCAVCEQANETIRDIPS